MKKEFNASEHLDHIIDICRNTDFLHKTTILTGSNGSGKSLIRKMISGKIGKELESEGKTDIDLSHIVSSISMEFRTYNDPMWSGLNFARHDAPENPTSLETFRFISGLLNNSERYLVIDEPEIGMAEELQLLLCNFINEKLPALDTFGILIITHSRTIVNNILHDQFINLDGLTEQQWVNRVPQLPNYTLDEFEKRSHQLYLEVVKRSEKK